MNKTCKKCNVSYPETDEFFFWDKRRNSYRLPCKRCDLSHRKEVRNTTLGRIISAAYAKIWRKNNPEKHAEANRNWKNKYPEKAAIIAKKEREKNKETYRNSGKIRVSIRRTRQSGNGGFYTKLDIENIYKKQCGKCAYCGIDVGNKYHIDHIIPVARGGNSNPDNLAISCPRCNHSKGAKLLSEWKK